MKYAFVDRDGTIIYEPTPQETKPGDVPYQVDNLKKLRILPGVIAGFRKLVADNYKLVMISNQDGLGTKTFSRQNFYKPQNKLLKILKENQIEFEEILICPHFPKDNCSCRKPKTGLLNDFLKKNIDWKNSLVIGNGEADKGLAKNLGLKFIEVKTNTTFNINI